MKEFADLLPVLTPFALSVPDPVAIHYLRQAAIDFCARTRAWRDVQDIEISAEPYEDVYPPADASIHEIEKVLYRDPQGVHWYELEKQPYSAVDLNMLSDDQYNGVRPNVYFQSEPGTLSIAPRAQGILRVSLFLKPSQTAEYGPDFLFSKYPMTLVNGALSYILTIPDQPYTNPTFGGIKLAQFNAECDANFALNIRGEQRAPARTKASFF